MKNKNNIIDIQKEMKTFRKKLYKNEPQITYSFINNEGTLDFDINSLSNLDIFDAFNIINDESKRQELNEQFKKSIIKEYDNIIEVDFRKKH